MILHFQDHEAIVFSVFHFYLTPASWVNIMAHWPGLKKKKAGSDPIRWWWCEYEWEALSVSVPCDWRATSPGCGLPFTWRHLGLPITLNRIRNGWMDPKNKWLPLGQFFTVFFFPFNAATCHPENLSAPICCFVSWFKSQYGWMDESKLLLKCLPRLLEHICQYRRHIWPSKEMQWINCIAINMFHQILLQNASRLFPAQTMLAIVSNTDLELHISLHPPAPFLYRIQ